MPIKYTFKQVQDIFTQNKCILVSEKYENQLGKLEYIASCGHNTCVVFKDFKNGCGVKCRNCALEIPTYEDVVKKFADKGSNVTMTKEEFYDKKIIIVKLIISRYAGTIMKLVIKILLR